MLAYQRAGQNTLMAEDWFLEELLVFPEKERTTEEDREKLKLSLG